MMFHVERWQSGCFTWNKNANMLKRFKLNFFALFNKNNLVCSWKMCIFATDLEI